MNDNMSPVLSFVGRSSVGSASARPGASAGDSSSWYEAMSKAWGQTLDAQASQLPNMSTAIGAPRDPPPNPVTLPASALTPPYYLQPAAPERTTTRPAPTNGHYD